MPDAASIAVESVRAARGDFAVASVLLACAIVIAASLVPTASAAPGELVAMGSTPTLRELSAQQASRASVGARAALEESEPVLTASPLRARPVPPPGIDASIGVDPALASASQPMSPIASPQTTFDGIANIDQASIVGTKLPPDPVGDVGPNHYVQAVNTTFAVFTKDGLLISPPGILSLQSLFAFLAGSPCATEDRGDPVVMYDELADRWLVTQFAFADDNGAAVGGTPIPPYHQCVAVSQSPDPTGVYNVYAFEISTGDFPDYPKLGVWPDGPMGGYYLLSANAFDLPTPPSVATGGFAVALDRSALLAGAAANAVVKFEPTAFGLLPADSDGSTPPPAGAPGVFAVLEDTNIDPAITTDALAIWELDVTDFATSTGTFARASTLPVAPFDSAVCANNANPRNCIPQPGSAFGLDPLAGQLMHRLAYRNFGALESLVVNHIVDVSGADQAGIRWYELQRVGGAWSVAQQSTFGPDADHRWMGSAAMDASGNIAIGYSVSGPTTFPSLRFAGRFFADPPSLLTHGEQTLIAGGGSQTHASSRWGDYSALSVDPTDGCTFWFTGEYYPVTDAAGWRTHIGSFTLLGNPLVTSTSHSPGVWSNDPTVDAAWTAPSASCGVDGYSLSWDRDATGVPDTVKDLEESGTATTSPPLADGDSHYLHVQGIDDAGNVSDVVTFGPLQIDSVDPTRPKLHGTRLRRDYQRGRSFAIRLSADDAGSGIAMFTLQSRRATVKHKFGKRRVVGEVNGDARKMFTGKLGSTYCFSGFATDAAGNVSERRAERCTAIPLDDRTFPRARGWTRGRNAASYRGSVTVSRSAGATLRRAGIAGRELALIARRCASCGVVRVTFRNKVLKTINLGAKPFGRERLIRLASFDRLRRGTVLIEVVSSGKRVEIDGLGVSRV